MSFLPSHTAPARLLVFLFTACCAALAQADAYWDVEQLARNGKFDSAMQAATVHIDKNPHDPQMRFLLGTLQSDSGNKTQAQQTFLQLTQDFPELPEPYNNLAVLWAAKGDYDKAREALEMAVRTNPDYAIALENLGDIYAKLAARAYERSLNLDAQHSTAASKLTLVRQLLAPTPKSP